MIRLLLARLLDHAPNLTGQELTHAIRMRQLATSRLLSQLNRLLRARLLHQVEMTGFEPVTSWLQTTRSPS